MVMAWRMGIRIYAVQRDGILTGINLEEPIEKNIKNEGWSQYITENKRQFFDSSRHANMLMKIKYL